MTILRYRYSTLELKRILNSASSFLAQSPQIRICKQVLNQIPNLTNYTYNPHSFAVDTIKNNKWYYSQTPLHVHIRLCGLSENCFLNLTRKQHEQIQSLTQEIYLHT